VTRGELPIRIHSPTPDVDSPALVYYHGGGMIMGSVKPFASVALAEQTVTGCARAR
jgi:acetyl esterase